MRFSIDHDRLALVLDLDDTLYLERDYVRSGLRAAGDWLRLRRGVSGLEQAACALFEQGLREKLFDAALHSLGVDAAPPLISRLVFEYRRHAPAIALARDAAYFLRHTRHALALVTDGSPLAQRMKVAALGLRDFPVRPIIYTGDWERSFWKPHARAFELVRKSISADAFIYVADNPTKDFLAPRAMGWRTVQIERPERIHKVSAPSPLYRADLSISSFEELADALQILGDSPAKMASG
jgi:putative hydrolase of the HAD superfamily